MSSKKVTTYYKTPALYGESLVEHARQWAVYQHDDQVDKTGAPYEIHLEAVAEGAAYLVSSGVIAYSGSLSELRAAGYLHDVVEDVRVIAGSKKAYDPVTYDHLMDEGFPAGVLLLVKAMTKKPAQAQLDYLVQLIEAGKGAMILKLADLYHNTDPRRVSMIDANGRYVISGDTQVRLLTKYTKSIRVLEALLDVPAADRRGWYVEQHLAALKRAGYKNLGYSTNYSNKSYVVGSTEPTSSPGFSDRSLPPTQLYAPSDDWKSRQNGGSNLDGGTMV